MSQLFVLVEEMAAASWKHSVGRILPGLDNVSRLNRYVVEGSKKKKSVTVYSRFGWVKWHRKPITEDEWARVFSKHKYFVPNVTGLDLIYSRAGGPGLAGIRHFKLDALPPIAFHNPGIDIKFQSVQEKDVLPIVTVELENGTKHEINCRGLRDSAILEKIYELDGSSIERDAFRSHNHVVYFE